MINVDVKKCPVMSKYDVRVCNVYVSVVRIKVRTPRDLYCLFTSSKVILKLSQRARGHFMTLIENDV